MTFPFSGFDAVGDLLGGFFDRCARSASYDTSGNLAPVVVDFAPLVDLERHRNDSMMVITSPSVRTILFFPKIRQALSSLARSRTRLSDVPKRWATSLGR